MNVIISLEAEDDFTRIGDYIAGFNPARAVSFVEELLERCETLKDMPLRYQLLPGHEQSDIRRMPHANYVVFYTVEEDTVYILHILNAAQDHKPILFPDDPV